MTRQRELVDEVETTLGWDKPAERLHDLPRSAKLRPSALQLLSEPRLWEVASPRMDAIRVFQMSTPEQDGRASASGPETILNPILWTE